jgi:hypothetical protein
LQPFRGLSHLTNDSDRSRLDQGTTMLKNSLGAAVVAAVGLVPLTAGSHAAANEAQMMEMIITPLGLAIASQGNDALRAIRREARACLRGLKPAPLDALIQPVKRQVAPSEVAQSLAL